MTTKALHDTTNFQTRDGATTLEGKEKDAAKEVVRLYVGGAGSEGTVDDGILALDKWVKDHPQFGSDNDKVLVSAALFMQTRHEKDEADCKKELTQIEASVKAVAAKQHTMKLYALGHAAISGYMHGKKDKKAALQVLEKNSKDQKQSIFDLTKALGLKETEVNDAKQRTTDSDLRIAALERELHFAALESDAHAKFIEAMSFVKAQREAAA